MGDEWDFEVGDSLGELARIHLSQIAGANFVLPMADNAGSLHVLREAEGVWRLTPEGPIKACVFQTASIVPPPPNMPQPAKPEVTVVQKESVLIVRTTDAGVNRDLGFKLEYDC